MNPSTRRGRMVELDSRVMIAMVTMKCRAGECANRAEKMLQPMDLIQERDLER